jgi:hypothetical protein
LATLIREFCLDAGGGLLGKLQADTVLCSAGGRILQPLGKYADSVAGRICRNIRALGLSTVA